MMIQDQGHWNFAITSIVKIPGRLSTTLTMKTLNGDVDADPELMPTWYASRSVTAALCYHALHTYHQHGS